MRVLRESRVGGAAIFRDVLGVLLALFEPEPGGFRYRTSRFGHPSHSLVLGRFPHSAAGTRLDIQGVGAADHVHIQRWWRRIYFS